MPDLLRQILWGSTCQGLDLRTVLWELQQPNGFEENFQGGG